MKDFSEVPPIAAIIGSKPRRAPTRTRTTRFYDDGPKRIFDVLFVLVTLPVLAPLILVLWCLVKLDGGPGVFAQPRIGVNGHPFQCLKLRTMRVNAEEHLSRMCDEDPALAAEWKRYQKIKHDPRITKVGTFLRRTSLDELPQIVNVLRGDMSLVGPRPFMQSQERLYCAAGGRAYFKMRPGVTGMWQVEGRGASCFLDRIHYDDAYYETRSLRTDLRLILKTATVVLKGTGS